MISRELTVPFGNLPCLSGTYRAFLCPAYICWVTYSRLLCACRPLLSLRVDHPNLPIETQVTHTMVKVKVIPKVTCNLAPSVPLRWLSHVLIDHIFFGYSSRRYLYVVEYFIFLTLDNPFVLFTASLSAFYRLLCYIIGLCLLDNVTFSGLHLFSPRLTDVSTAGLSIRCVKTVSVRLCDVCQTYISSFNSTPITTRLG